MHGKHRNAGFLGLTILCALLGLGRGDAYAACAHPSGTVGEMIYNEPIDAFQGCTPAGWQVFNAFPDPCGAITPEIGVNCHDGTIYAGRSPDGNLKMFTTPADGGGRTWNTGNSTGYVDVSGLANCMTASHPSCRTGKANTPIIAAADAQSGGGFDPHAAAVYCHNLEAHGYTDWYLPALDELGVLYTNRNAGLLAGTFNMTGTFPGTHYWSSSEYSNVGALQINFGTGSGYPFTASTNVDKRWPFSVRCVRTNSVITEGLVGHWAFDSTSGTTAIDSSGNGNNGTLVDINPASNWVPGYVNNALLFNGTGAVVNVPSAASINDVFLTGGTLMGWIYPATWGESNFGRLTNKRYHGFWIANNPPEIATLGGFYQFTDAEARWYGSANALELNKWQHVAITYDASSPSNTPTFYVNGVALTTTVRHPVTGTAVSDSGHILTIGNRIYHDRAFDGQLDDFRLYNRILTPQEIQQIYNAQRH